VGRAVVDDLGAVALDHLARQVVAALGDAVDNRVDRGGGGRGHRDSLARARDGCAGWWNLRTPSRFRAWTPRPGIRTVPGVGRFVACVVGVMLLVAAPARAADCP